MTNSDEESDCPSEYRRLFGPKFDYERYGEDAEYRLSIGPSIELWGEMGFDESLTGLTFEWEFPFASSDGKTHKAKARVGKSEGWGSNQTTEVFWTFEGSEEEFLLPIATEDILECYFVKKDRSDIPSLEKFEGKFMSPLMNLDPSSMLLNFKLPSQAIELFDCVREEQDDRWKTTIACFNDSENSLHYDPTGERCYPLSFLLTLIVICKYYDPNTQLPIIKKDTPDATQTQKLTDQFTGMIKYRSTSASAMLDISRLLAKKAIAYEENKDPSLDETKDVLMHVEAIILTLSYDYETVTDAWYVTRILLNLDKILYNLVMSLGRILLHEKAIDGIRVLGNANIIATHLKKGTFVQFLGRESNFGEAHQDAMDVWDNVVVFVDELKRAGDSVYFVEKKEQWIQLLIHVKDNVNGLYHFIKNNPQHVQ